MDPRPGISGRPARTGSPRGARALHIGVAQRGGAVFLQGDAAFHHGCEFINNTAQEAGGDIYAAGGTLFISSDISPYPKVQCPRSASAAHSELLPDCFRAHIALPGSQVVSAGEEAGGVGILNYTAPPSPPCPPPAPPPIALNVTTSTQLAGAIGNHQIELIYIMANISLAGDALPVVRRPLRVVGACGGALCSINAAGISSIFTLQAGNTTRAELLLEGVQLCQGQTHIENQAMSQLKGGALRVGRNTSARIEGCSFAGNTATGREGQGAAVAVFDGGEMVVQDTHFVRNTAHEGGGAIYAEGAVLVLSGSVFNANLNDDILVAGGEVRICPGVTPSLPRIHPIQVPFHFPCRPILPTPNGDSILWEVVSGVLIVILLFSVATAVYLIRNNKCARVVTETPLEEIVDMRLTMLNAANKKSVPAAPRGSSIIKTTSADDITKCALARAARTVAVTARRTDHNPLGGCNGTAQPPS
ncbi:hypothetical protein CYMTET_36684 [Cymbomonas tetramitiformis]|uniref:Right handed beta helix domain-containing protein n=1 Tax=Cymbomonas tetramitiformis TaxID=36881 RepID=A0AAE0CGU9_9CHLO|nr:hypothetical protein CYMTET_36684 [Cymbomonas tetramitiformis]